MYCKHKIHLDVYCKNCELDFLGSAKNANFNDNNKIHAIITGTIEKCISIIKQAIKEAELTPVQEWLVYGRIVQYLFGTHFRLSYDGAENAVHKRLQDFRRKSLDSGIKPEPTEKTQ